MAFTRTKINGHSAHEEMLCKDECVPTREESAPPSTEVLLHKDGRQRRRQWLSLLESLVLLAWAMPSRVPARPHLRVEPSISSRSERNGDGFQEAVLVVVMVVTRGSSESSQQWLPLVPEQLDC